MRKLSPSKLPTSRASHFRLVLASSLYCSLNQSLVLYTRVSSYAVAKDPGKVAAARSHKCCEYDCHSPLATLTKAMHLCTPSTGAVTLALCGIARASCLPFQTKLLGALFTCPIKSATAVGWQPEGAFLAPFCCWE